MSGNSPTSAAETSTGVGSACGFVVSIWESWAKNEDMEGRRVGFLLALGFMLCSTGVCQSIVLEELGLGVFRTFIWSCHGGGSALRSIWYYLELEIEE